MFSHKENEEHRLAILNHLLSSPSYYGYTNPTLLWTSFLQSLIYSPEVKWELDVEMAMENEQTSCEAQAYNKNSGLQITHYQARYYQYFDLCLKEN